jgi:hypothetical protein
MIKQDIREVFMEPSLVTWESYQGKNWGRALKRSQEY